MLISIIIPAFNRTAPLAATLASAQVACATLGEPAEIILVDDGSTPPLAEALPELQSDPLVKVIRQPNQGSIVARLTGLASASGEFILFLDSDDLIAPEKLRLHAQALRASKAVACYDDVGELVKSSTSLIRVREKLPLTSSFTELVLRIQPPPHGCVYRRDFLKNALSSFIVPALRPLDPVGDVWLYYNLAPCDGPVVKVDAPLSLTGVHEEDRYSQHWEKLGVAALRLAELFMTNCPVTPETMPVRRIVGEVAFAGWRRLPRDFDTGYTKRTLAIWRQAPPSELSKLGGPFFRVLARFLGPLAAGRLLRLRNHTYAQCRTLPDDELARLLSQ
ncbi:MAG TPA: glycosyltransferase family 2 protein [Rariglobus sp.]|jgi:glycosyltransferase involved in cell wall biosynthesis|nr:glycosyltransferase family 2 protein [Rariglobus sp.]